MLTADDRPIIQRAIQRRLDTEPGVNVIEIKIAPVPGRSITVGVHALLDDTLQVRSVFELPDPFEHGHLVDEIDQIAEQCKAARKDYFGRGRGLILQPETQLAGTGTRGLWKRYGLRVLEADDG